MTNVCDCGPNKLAEYRTSLLNYNKLYKKGCWCILYIYLTLLYLKPQDIFSSVLLQNSQDFLRLTAPKKVDLVLN